MLYTNALRFCHFFSFYKYIFFSNYFDVSKLMDVWGIAFFFVEVVCIFSLLVYEFHFDIYYSYLKSLLNHAWCDSIVKETNYRNYPNG